MVPKEQILAAQIASLVHERLSRMLSVDRYTREAEELLFVGREGGDLFVKLGVYEKDSNKYNYTPITSPVNVVDIIESRPEISQNHFIELLGLFFRFFVGPGCKFSSTKHPFSPPDGYELLTNALIDYGFLSSKKDRVVWTDAAAEFMEDNGHWKQGVSKYDKYVQKEANAHQEEAVRAERLTSEIPQEVKAFLAKIYSEQGVVGVAKMLPRHFKDGQWNISPIERDVALMDVRMVMKIAKLLQQEF
ncbi:hypothetical protein [uncultured Tateyamaria sp.]|uniref:hypothetical protein n=1 Tax=uncultured Tateyamaria sp. TaxID=455651 RepID=UPI0026125400|nr:hypothetical protein [uncultured Tateyamaria sp.]